VAPVAAAIPATRIIWTVRRLGRPGRIRNKFQFSRETPIRGRGEQRHYFKSFGGNPGGCPLGNLHLPPQGPCHFAFWGIPGTHARRLFCCFNPPTRLRVLVCYSKSEGIRSASFDQANEHPAQGRRPLTPSGDRPWAIAISRPYFYPEFVRGPVAVRGADTFPRRPRYGRLSVNFFFAGPGTVQSDGSVARDLLAGHCPGRGLHNTSRAGVFGTYLCLRVQGHRRETSPAGVRSGARGTHMFHHDPKWSGGMTAHRRRFPGNLDATVSLLLRPDNRPRCGGMGDVRFELPTGMRYSSQHFSRNGRLGDWPRRTVPFHPCKMPAGRRGLDTRKRGASTWKNAGAAMTTGRAPSQARNSFLGKLVVLVSNERRRATCPG